MKLESSRQLPVSQEQAWQALNDLEVLKRCIPGCESLVQNSEGALEAVVVMRIGPVGARFGGKVTLEDVKAPSSYRLVFAGQGGAAGFAKGEARVELIPLGPSATELRYTSEAAVGGKLAQVGSRLIESSAKKLAEEFFTRFEESLAPPAEAEAEAAAEAAAAAVQLALPEVGSVQVDVPVGGSAPVPSPGPQPACAPAAAARAPTPWVPIILVAAVAMGICLYVCH